MFLGVAVAPFNTSCKPFFNFPRAGATPKPQDKLSQEQWKNSKRNKTWIQATE